MSAANVISPARVDEADEWPDWIVASDPDWAALMTTRQFAALERWIGMDALVRELVDLGAQVGRKQRGDDELAEAAAWLRNGWSTERLLRFNLAAFPGPEKAFALHWAFPQAYYSAYALAVAFLLLRGSSENSHAAVIRRLGDDMLADKYPPIISFLALGGPSNITYAHISKHPTSCSLAFSASDPETVETQIAQFLCATRNIDLKIQKSKMRLRTKAGKPKRNFSTADWDSTSARLGPTSIFSLLYRNRLRANYGEIDTYLSKDLDCEVVYRSLVHVTHCLNLTHESLIRHRVGEKRFARLTEMAGGNNHDFVEARGRVLREAMAPVRVR